MDSILLIAGNEKGKAVLKELLTGCGELTVVNNGNEARRLLTNRDFGLCVINAPLKDEFGTDLAMHIANRGASQVMLLIRNDLADEISAQVGEFGVFVVPKPISRSYFWDAYRLVTAAHHRMLSLQNKNEQLQNRINDIRLIDQAKCLLIQFLDVTEAEAHRFIEKQAMDRRMTKREIAASILKKYGDGKQGPKA